MNYIFQSPLLTQYSGDPAISSPVHVDSEGPSKNKTDWKHTAASAAKLLLRAVERASDAFPPLKSVAAGLCAILENCEVRPTVVHPTYDAHNFHSKRSSINRRSSRWDIGLKHSLNRSASPLPRVISGRKQGGKNWNGRSIIYTIGSRG